MQIVNGVLTSAGYTDTNANNRFAKANIPIGFQADLFVMAGGKPGARDTYRYLLYVCAGIEPGIVNGAIFGTTNGNDKGSVYKYWAAEIRGNTFVIKESAAASDDNSVFVTFQETAVDVRLPRLGTVTYEFESDYNWFAIKF